MENTTPKKQHYSLPIRVIAGILVVSLLLSLVSNGLIKVRIQPGEQTEAATNYLVENTGYVQEGRFARLKEKLQTLVNPTELEDHYRLAGTQIAEEKYAEALESIEICLLLDPQTDPVLTKDLLMKQGCLLVLLEDFSEALGVLDSVTELDPGHADAYLVKAQIYAQQADYPMLAQVLDSYISLKPQDAQIRLVLAQTCFTLERYEDAREQYLVLLDTPEALEEPTQIAYLLALTNIQLSDFQAAEDSLIQVLEKDPDVDGLYYYLGVCQMAREDYQQAADSLTRSIDRGSMVQLSHYSRGVCGLVIEGYDLTLALTDLQAAAEYAMDDGDPDIAQQAAALLQSLTTPPEETTAP